MVLTVSSALSPVIGLSCHRRQRSCLRQLDASVEAPGPHDFAVRVSAIRQRRCHVHRIPHPTSVTIAKRPSVGGDGKYVLLICASWQALFRKFRIGWSAAIETFRKRIASGGGSH